MRNRAVEIGTLEIGDTGMQDLESRVFTFICPSYLIT